MLRAIVLDVSPYLKAGYWPAASVGLKAPHGRACAKTHKWLERPFRPHGSASLVQPGDQVGGHLFLLRLVQQVVIEAVVEA